MSKPKPAKLRNARAPTPERRASPRTFPDEPAAKTMGLLIKRNERFWTDFGTAHPGTGANYTSTEPMKRETEDPRLTAK